jgi:hypothetical protein
VPDIYRAVMSGPTPSAATDASAVQVNGFKYTNSLDRAYNDAVPNVRSVTFDISRYGAFTHTLTFAEAVSEAHAIRAVEAYLSGPLTEEYYNKIREDTFDELLWGEAKEAFPCRGDTLTDAHYLEGAAVDDKGALTLVVGS